MGLADGLSWEQEYGLWSLDVVKFQDVKEPLVQIVIRHIIK